jgi:D-3-phosphoglycerate dehydrogenase
MFKILVTDDIGAPGRALLEAASDVEIRYLKQPERGELLAALAEADAVITRSGTALDAACFAAAPRLKVAGRAGVGLDNVDVTAATERGVLVMNTPEANILAAIEHTLGLMLAMCRRIPEAHAHLQAGSWERSRFLGRQLFQKTVGVIGLGRIGGRVAQRLQAFGAHVVGYDPFISEDVAERAGVELITHLDELLARADILTVHTPLTEETRGLIGAPQIARMKRGAMVVNCARGGIIEEGALLEALRSGQVAAAALDVFTEEPPRSPRLRELLVHPNVVATPHIGANTVEAQEVVSAQIVQQVLDGLRGINYRNVINLPFAEGADYRSLAPYLTLAEKIGALQVQLARGRLQRVEIECAGEAIEPHLKPITVALLKGLLTPILSEAVNYVNAPLVAAERGISVAQAQHATPDDYANSIICRVSSGGESRLIAGALFSHSQPRIVRVDDFPMDVRPFGWILVTRNRDVPGVIGQVGTLLGKHGINIAEWRTGRSAPGEVAFSFINVDSPVPEELLSELAAFPAMLEVRQVQL